MHFVFGGAFNGKRKWVADIYKNDSLTWISAYEQPAFPKRIGGEGVVVLEGIEMWVRELIHDSFTIDEAVAFFEQQLSEWQNQCNKLVLIGTEIGKGVVPMDETDRKWRDACGYVYQRIVRKAERVDQIWYGISTRLKGE
jgi:adenosylcobinamide kinase / adenosylcobinamide-phosphate guanylyltransferase